MNDTTSTMTRTDTTSEMEEDESTVLRQTLLLFGSILVVVTLTFCWIRKKFPRPFTIRQWQSKWKSPLATDQYGFVSWIWKLHSITEEQLVDQCGLDAVCFLRTLRFGFLLCCLGIFNSIWLFPLYATAPGNGPENNNNSSSNGSNAIPSATRATLLLRLTTGFVPATSSRFIGTVVAAYLLFGATMYGIFTEFQWFLYHRHRFLAQTHRARNYTVYVRHIPIPMSSSPDRLKQYLTTVLRGSSTRQSTRCRWPDTTGIVAPAATTTATNTTTTAAVIPNVKAMGDDEAAATTLTSCNHHNNVNNSNTVTKVEDDGVVLEVRFKIRTTQLQEKVQQREQIVRSLEDAVAQYRQTNGVLRPRHRIVVTGITGNDDDDDDKDNNNNHNNTIHQRSSPSRWCTTITCCRKSLDNDTTRQDGSKVGGGGGGMSKTIIPRIEEVDSMEYYATQLKLLNQQIRERIETMENKAISESVSGNDDVANTTTRVQEEDKMSINCEGGYMMSTNYGTLSNEVTNDAMETGLLHEKSAEETNETKNNAGLEALSKLTTGATKVVSGVNQVARQGATTLVTIVKGEEDGEYYNAGFVTFTSLFATNAALSMVHQQQPFSLEVLPAPDPQDVFWANVGRSHIDLQLGQLLSTAATVGICLLWTIPMAAFSALSTVDGLKNQFSWVEKAIDAFPPLEPILQQLAPFLVIVFNSLLPMILRRLSMYEGPVSGSVVEAATFTKLAAFMIIQTFFVTAISGRLMEGIKDIIDDPLSIIDLLAVTLPAQSTYFMQIAFVGTVIFIAMENLRVVPLIMAFLRRFVGPRRTEKQRQSTYWGIRPLADPGECEHASNMAQITVLYFMIILVYQTIAPLTSYILALCFLVLYPACLHQFVYVYPSSPDSGGVIWTSFIKVLMMCMLVAELALVGLMSLKKASIATPLMVPLIVLTILFNGYIRQQHFRVAATLPLAECWTSDGQNSGENFDLFRSQYMQDELREKEIYPEDIPNECLIQLGLASTTESVGEEETDSSLLVKQPALIPEVHG